MITAQGHSILNQPVKAPPAWCDICGLALRRGLGHSHNYGDLMSDALGLLFTATDASEWSFRRSQADRLVQKEILQQKDQ